MNRFSDLFFLLVSTSRPNLGLSIPFLKKEFNG
jgi:hypothetical protein